MAKATANELLRIVRGPGAAGKPQAAKAETDGLLVLVQIAAIEEDYPTLLARARERLALSKKRVGDRHPEVAQALNDFALGQMYAGDLAGAERSYLEVIDLDIALLGPEHPDVGQTLAGLGQAYRKLGKYPESEAAFRRALDIQVKALGEDHAVSQRTIKAIASLYTDWKKPAQAAAYTARLKPEEKKAAGK